MIEAQLSLTSPILCKTFSFQALLWNLRDYRVSPVKAAYEIDRDALVQIFAREGLDEEAAYIAAGLRPKVYKRQIGPSLLR
jgi:hypothetical protein